MQVKLKVPELHSNTSNSDPKQWESAERVLWFSNKPVYITPEVTEGGLSGGATVKGECCSVSLHLQPVRLRIVSQYL